MSKSEGAFLEKLEKLEGHFAAGFFGIMVAAIFLQVVNRTILKVGLGWTEELARYCMIWMVMLGTEMGLRSGAQIAIDIFVKPFPLIVRRALGFVSRLVVVGFCGLVFWYSLQILKTQFDSGQITASLQLPMYIPYFAITFGFFTIFIVQAVIFVMQVFKKNDLVEG